MSDAATASSASFESASVWRSVASAWATIAAWAVGAGSVGVLGFFDAVGSGAVAAAVSGLATTGLDGAAGFVSKAGLASVAFTVAGADCSAWGLAGVISLASLCDAAGFGAAAAFGAPPITEVEVAASAGIALDGTGCFCAGAALGLPA
ncbi:membrane hypothetical protein [Hyphomicrobiales bacterium]|nr:membrane hypothetical protein [Hyphomicrobiales bacterium]